jgi:hypothetical protein
VLLVPSTTELLATVHGRARQKDSGIKSTHPITAYAFMAISLLTPTVAKVYLNHDIPWSYVSHASQRRSPTTAAL